MSNFREIRIFALRIHTQRKTLVALHHQTITTMSDIEEDAIDESLTKVDVVNKYTASATIANNILLYHPASFPLFKDDVTLYTSSC